MGHLRRNVNYLSFLLFFILVAAGICAVGVDYGKRYVSSFQESEARKEHTLKGLYVLDPGDK
jgi:hypothetical protein